MKRIGRAALAIAKDDPAFEDGAYGFEDYLAMARAAFESIDVDELARKLQQRARYEGVVITDRQAQRIARDLRTYLLTGDESDE